jgi:GDP/UDP-N,N'-diacetylbacillosamine 2-epimerase (hydrolysing)
VRHAITKLAHIHFAAHKEFANRVKKLGEQDFRIHVTGAPLVDELVQGQATEKEELLSRYRINPNGHLILAVQHSLTEEESAAGMQIAETLKALVALNWPTILVYPNADAGSVLIRNQLAEYKQSNIRLFRNLPRADYLGFMKMATVMVGNSSSGIMEAPSFGIPCVNVGNRQRGRPQAFNVINTGYSEKEITNAIRRATKPDFVKQARATKNPYGDGYASEKSGNPERFGN